MAKKIRPGHIVVLRGLGPVGSGMPEVLVATAALSTPDLEGKVALISDTRVSGVSHGAIGVHCAPEAAVESGFAAPAGLAGSNWTGLNQFRLADTVAPVKSKLELPPSVDRAQTPYWLHPYTRFWSAGSITTLASCSNCMIRTQRSLASWSPAAATTVC